MEGLVLGPLEHVRKYFLSFSDTFLSVWALWLVGAAMPFVELAAAALISLGFVLAVVTFGHLLKEPVYESHTHVIPRLALLLFLLLLPREDNRFSADYMWLRHKRVPRG